MTTFWPSVNVSSFSQIGLAGCGGRGGGGGGPQAINNETTDRSITVEFGFGKNMLDSPLFRMIARFGSLLASNGASSSSIGFIVVTLKCNGQFPT